MTELPQQPESIAERIENTRLITAEDIRHLQELEVLKLTSPDRNYVVPLKKRDIEDKGTSNTDRQEAYLREQLGIEPENIILPNGKRLLNSLAVETIFSWIAAAHTLEKFPKREAEIVTALNATIGIQDQKHKLVESGTIEKFTQNGMQFFRTVRSLPKGALKELWTTLESALKEKQSKENPDQER